MVYEIAVNGMHCENCGAKVMNALQATAGVRHVDVRLDAGLARVVAEVPREQLEQAIRDAGYSVATN